jgi:hypothetical protein
MKKLPIGIQTFSEIREEGYLYIDKTEQIYNLIERGKIYFLSRPRRFGKSLLISTIEELFKGNKKLFRGLYIHGKWNWNKFPVIKLDFSDKNYETPEKLKESLNIFLNKLSEI